MAHVRQQIREAAETILNATPTNWSRVFLSRISPQRDLPPHLLVYVSAESSEADDIHVNHLQMREVTLTVRGRHRIVDGELIEEKLDAIASEVETKLKTTAVRALIPGVQSFVLTSTSFDELVDDEYERSYAEVTMTFRVRIFTTEGVPATFVY